MADAHTVGRRTDVHDALWTGQRLRCGLIEPSFVPSEDIQDWRDLPRSDTTGPPPIRRELDWAEPNALVSPGKLVYSNYTLLLDVHGYISSKTEYKTQIAPTMTLT